MVNYFISDFIAKLNIARRNRLKTIIIIPSKIIFELLKIFEDLGIIIGYHIINDKVEIILKYHESKCAFTHLTVLSKPSRRIYVSLLDLYKFKEKYSSDIMVLSTSKGVMLDVDCIKNKQTGLLLLRISI